VLEDCVCCGVCCFSETDRPQRAGEASPVGRCAALVLAPHEGTYLCSGYERRPEVCRTLERGSSACAGERATKGDRPRRALTLVR